MMKKTFLVMLIPVLLAAGCSTVPVSIPNTASTPVAVTAAVEPTRQAPLTASPPAPTLDSVAPARPPLSTEPGPLTGPGGISYEENLASNPPQPEGLTARRTAEGVLLEWQLPIPADVPHDYSDTPLFYRVYRRAETGQPLLLGTAETLRYLDATAKAGETYYYAVSAVHERNTEGTRTNEVEVR